MTGVFESFLQGGFECSTHRMRNARQDVIAASRHDVTAERDYQHLRRYGIRTVRDGLRWHLIERLPGRYEWSSFLPMLKAATRTNTQVIWDLCHYGIPDGLDILSSAFVDRFARFAGAVARLVSEESPEVPMFCPINEISFWAWAGGTVAFMNPFMQGNGDELKHQLVRAALAAIDAIWTVHPRARIIHADPVINVVAEPGSDAATIEDAENRRLSQYHAWDIVAGRRHPELGGAERYLDVVGVNYYWNNQRYVNGPTIEEGHPLYRPFRSLLLEVYERYQRPIFIAETGIEGDRRADWMTYMAAEARAALRSGVPLEGFCWYPILDHPGWGDARYCPNGLLGYADARGRRPVHAPLAAAWQRERKGFADLTTERASTNGDAHG